MVILLVKDRQFLSSCRNFLQHKKNAFVYFKLSSASLIMVLVCVYGILRKPMLSDFSSAKRMYVGIEVRSIVNRLDFAKMISLSNYWH